MLQHIVSGGQDGAERAALDVALHVGLPFFGWCAPGRLASIGSTALQAHLREIVQGHRGYINWNVRDSDGILVLKHGAIESDVRYAIGVSRNQHVRPALMVDLEKPMNYRAAASWVVENDIAILNVVGLLALAEN